MPEVTIEGNVEVWCASCNAGLCKQTTVNGNNLYVEPCDTCLEKAAQEGYDKGYNDGHEEAKRRFEDVES